MLEAQLLNAIITSRDDTALVRNGLIDKKQWLTHQEPFLYITNHLKEYGELPSVSSVISNTDNFEIEETSESVETLCKKLIERNLKNAQKEFLQDAAKKFGELSAYELLLKMEEKVQELQKLSAKRVDNGLDWTSSGVERANEYNERKKKDFSRRVPFLFEELTDILGEMHGGYYVSIMGFTSKGKTWLGLLQSLVANRAGLKVVIESGEMSKPEVAFRLDSLDGGFNNRGLFTGNLDFHSEEQYLEWLNKFNKENGRAPMIIKTQEDWPNGLTLQQIEHDIQVNKPDVMVIDQFSLIKHSSNDRHGMTNTSRRLKELAGKYGMVIILLYQANGDSEKRKGKEENAEDGVKELTPPRMSDYSETIAVIQDSDTVLTFDSTTWKDEQTKQQCGKALLYVGKNRSGGEGTELDLNWVPNNGIIHVRRATDAF